MERWVLDVVLATPPRRKMNRALNRIRGMLPLLLLLLVGQRIDPVQSQCYPVQIEIFENEDECSNGEDPVAVGRMYGDGTCRATQVISSDTANRTYSFPGRYIATCSGSNLEISDSGCTSNECTNSNGGDVCDREFTPASFYSRLDPPIYKLASDSSESYRFCMLLTDSEGNNIIFTLVGDCAASCGDRTAVPNRTPPPELKTPSPAPVATYRTVTPTTAGAKPVTARPTNKAAAGATATPSSGGASSSSKPPAPPAPTSQPSASGSESGGGGGNGSGSTLRPTAQSTTRSPTGVNPSVSEQQSKSGPSNFTAIVAGSVVAGALVVILVLLIGFVLGVYRQRKRDARSASVSESEAGSHEDLRRLALGHGGGPGANIPVALASTTATARTPPMFESSQIIVPSGQDDDVSTLGTPLGVSFLEETVGESSYRTLNKLLGGEQEEGGASAAAIERTATEDSADLFTTGESKAVFSDDASFEQQFDTENEPPSEPQSSIARASDAAVNSSMHYVVTVPPGRLGMVIDDYFNVTGALSPASKLGGTAGTPTVHALKDDSILRQRGVKVGDLLETVDGVDVTDLNCLDVSRMITGKSTATRVLGFARQKNALVNAEE